ncbi:hypothetical protein HDE_02418 [Halotydeus destructor]|nr:hypothetical protein HDE_02418 [Halotydeus destructor]
MNRHCFQPEQPTILDTHITPDTKFTFVDFIPGAIERSSSSVMQTAEVKYHCFCDMIDTANDWLRENLEWEVFNCETVMLLYKFNDGGSYYELRPDDTSFYIYGSEKNNVLKAMRIWIKRREGSNAKDSPELQVLKHINFVPIVDERTNKFETLDDVVNRVNKQLDEGRIEGRILTIETLQCDAGHDWTVLPDVSLSFFSNKSVFILRLFIEQGPPTEQEIGIADFVPQHLSGGGFFKRPKFESYNDVMSRASTWLTEEPDIDFKNAQSIDIKLKSLGSMDTKSMTYTEHGDYLRIFRIAYTKPIKCTLPEEEPSTMTLSSPVFLASKLFYPSKKNDTISDMRCRLEEWVLEATKELTEVEETLDTKETQHQPRVLCAETVKMFCKSEMSEQLDTVVDDPFQYNRFGTKNGYIFMILRLYFDIGFVAEKKITMKVEAKQGPANSSVNSCNTM